MTSSRPSERPSGIAIVYLVTQIDGADGALVSYERQYAGDVLQIHEPARHTSSPQSTTPAASSGDSPRDLLAED